jgi:hypothetical protein
LSIASRRSSSARLSTVEAAGRQHGATVRRGIIFSNAICYGTASPFSARGNDRAAHMVGEESFTQQSSPDSRPNDLEQLMKMGLIDRKMPQEEIKNSEI